MTKRCIASSLLCIALCAPAQAAQVCAWMTEKNKPDDVHAFELWLSADKEIEFLYKLDGDGITGDGFKAHSPSSGTFVLQPGKPDKPWGFGTTMPQPGKIDITIELHQKPADIFDETPTPLIAQFAFRRDVPATEKKAPPVLTKKQCAPLP